MNPAFGGVSGEPAGQAGFFGAANENHRFALAVKNRCQRIWGEVQGHLNVAQFIGVSC